MKKENERKSKAGIVFVIVFAVAFIGLLAFAIWEYIVSEKSIVRLGNYLTLTYTSNDRDRAATEVTDMLVKRSVFGGLVKKETETRTQRAMAKYQTEANRLEMTFPEYLSTFFGTTEDAFRENVKEAAELVVKEEFVLDAVADREGIELTDTRYQFMLAEYMEADGYTDVDAYLKEYPEQELRAIMRRNLTIDWLLERASGPELPAKKSY